MRILLTEPDPTLAQSLKTGLQQAHYAVDLAQGDDETIIIHYIQSNPYDLIILNQYHLKPYTKSTPTLTLTPFGTPPTPTTIPKPFPFQQLLTHIQTLTPTQKKQKTHTLANLTLDPNRQQLTQNQTPIPLTAKEYSLISYLFQNQNKVITRTELIEHLYDETFDKDSNLIDVFISRLRKKLGKDGELIQTVRGRGYMLVVETTISA